MALLAFIIVYVAVCYGGRHLLRAIRRNQDIFLYLRSCQETTKIGVLLTGFFGTMLLAISLLTAMTDPTRYLPWMWYVLLVVSITATLLLVLLHYTEVDYVQIAVFSLVAAVLLLGLFTVIAVDAPDANTRYLTQHLQQREPPRVLIGRRSLI